MKQQLWNNLLEQNKVKFNSCIYEKLSKVRFKSNGEIVRNCYYRFARRHCSGLIRIFESILYYPLSNQELNKPGRMGE